MGLDSKCHKMSTSWKLGFPTLIKAVNWALTSQVPHQGAVVVEAVAVTFLLVGRAAPAAFYYCCILLSF